MELIFYNEKEKVSTLKISDEELSLIVSVLGGVLNTWKCQDSTVLGIDKERMRELDSSVRNVFLSGWKNNV